MIKEIIEKIFKIKILPRWKYKRLVDSIAICGNLYRKYSSDSYHAFGLNITMPENEANKICLVENIIWDDIKDKINEN